MDRKRKHMPSPNENVFPLSFSVSSQAHLCLFHLIINCVFGVQCGHIAVATIIQLNHHHQ